MLKVLGRIAFSGSNLSQAHDSSHELHQDTWLHFPCDHEKHEAVSDGVPFINKLRQYGNPCILSPDINQ
jgi:hypothetical protein